jgi:uncharacterized protein (DUF3820 family)
MKTENSLLDFGKYENVPIRKVPTPYLIWLRKERNYKEWNAISAQVLENRRRNPLDPSTSEATPIELQNISPPKKDREKVLTYGKYEGKRVGDVPIDYFFWIIDNLKVGPMVQIAQKEIRRRTGLSSDSARSERELDRIRLQELEKKNPYPVGRNAQSKRLSDTARI